MKKLAMAVVAAASLAPFQANSANSNIPFGGSVGNTCVITVGPTGVLAASADFTVLGSEEAGGSAGTAQVLATGAGYALSADAPAGFASFPATGNTNVTFEANYSSTGANTIAQTDGGTATALGRGMNTVTVNMSGTKNVVGETFAAGAYTAVVILRCE